MTEGITHAEIASFALQEKYAKKHFFQCFVMKTNHNLKSSVILPQLRRLPIFLKHYVQTKVFRIRPLSSTVHATQMPKTSRYLKALYDYWGCIVLTQITNRDLPHIYYLNIISSDKIDTIIFISNN